MDDLLRSLPFDLDDAAAVAAAFAAWQQEPTDERRAVLRLWSYATAHRYALRKLAREPHATPLDLDTLRDGAYDRIDAHLGTVREPDRFVHWASAVCANGFKAWLRRRPVAASALPDDDRFTDDAPPPDADAPPAPEAVLGAARAAVERLPPSLREVARQRLLFGRDYAAIAAETGRDVATLRAFVKKARDRLRADPGLRALWEDGG